MSTMSKPAMLTGQRANACSTTLVSARRPLWAELTRVPPDAVSTCRFPIPLLRPCPALPGTAEPSTSRGCVAFNLSMFEVVRFMAGTASPHTGPTSTGHSALVNCHKVRTDQHVGKRKEPSEKHGDSH
ncbi:unnamed protein product [Protopolystoma xenopodis]|uniref:Uncharacterized protein n=1 Tax=Protopolystoma xenopodis TaxID=117903 RepID=A0A448X655_9PLAT|nr:unnamed protein product [Protopolystoma xenopodis]